jgi:N12 class adenine-specific DNA methylase
VVDNKIERIVYYDKPAGNMFPSKSVTPEQRKLKGFNWRFVARPLNKDDIFRKVDLQPVAPTKESVEPGSKTEPAKEAKE